MINLWQTHWANSKCLDTYYQEVCIISCNRHFILFSNIDILILVFIFASNDWTKMRQKVIPFLLHFLQKPLKICVQCIYSTTTIWEIVISSNIIDRLLDIPEIFGKFFRLSDNSRLSNFYANFFTSRSQLARVHNNFEWFQI